jgi:predicted AlkP superfamily phosphohydrolase/phosphomutase
MPAASSALALVRSLAEIPAAFFDVIRSLPGQPVRSVVYAAPLDLRADPEVSVPRRLAVLGFDALDVDLVLKWSAEGRLPAFRRLLGESAWCRFDLPAEYSSGMVWPSITTGLAPSQHQAWFGTRLIDGQYRVRPRRMSDLRGQPFWTSLAEAGARIVVADVPFTAVNPALGGRQLGYWGSHEWMPHTGSHPPQLLTELSRRVGQYPIGAVVEDTWARAGARDFARMLSQAIHLRSRILESLCEDDWDFFFGVFPESHSAGHYLWHEAGDPQALRRIYEDLDCALARFLSRLPPQAGLAVVLSHGMGPNYNGCHLFPELLARFNARWSGSIGSAASRSLLDRIWSSTVTRLPAHWRIAAGACLPVQARRWLSSRRQQNARLWRSSPAFALPATDGFSAVRVNLAGREPAGRISGPAAYAGYLDSLAAELSQWTIEGAGHRAVARIWRCAASADALRLGAAPDLMVWWDNSRPVTAIHSPSLGTVRGESSAARSGEHVMHSLLLLRVPHGAPGRRNLAGMGLTDIAPTLLDYVGLAAPASMNGRSRLRELTRP